MSMRRGFFPLENWNGLSNNKNLEKNEKNMLTLES
jgi:hypothetical protein